MNPAVRRLQALVASQVSIEEGYAARVRLARAVSEMDAWIAQECDLGADYLTPLVDELRVISDRVMQPSAPFDGAWQIQWERIHTVAVAILEALSDAELAGGIAGAGQ